MSSEDARLRPALNYLVQSTAAAAQAFADFGAAVDLRVEDERIPPTVAVAARIAGLRVQGPGALARAIGIDVPERYERALAGIYVGVDEGTRTSRKQKRARCKQRRRERISTAPKKRSTT